MFRTVIALLLAALAPPAFGKAYKCTDADGNVTFQQVPCPEEQAQDVPLILKPATLTDREKFDAEAYRRGMTPDELRAAIARAQRQTGFRSSQPATVVDPHVGQMPPPRRTGGRGFRGTGGQSAETASANPCPPGQYPANQSRNDPNQGFSSSSGYTTLKCVGPSRQQRTYTVSSGSSDSTRQLTDQNGNTYTLPPGSSFATDNGTGKQCFVYGNFIDCD